MDTWNTLAFSVFPYLALTTFAVGHPYRYFTDLYHWNARSSELLDKGSLKVGIWLFHWGVIFTFVGHAGGLLIPQSVYDAFGIDGATHTRVAFLLGLLFGLAAFAGSLLLLWRRFSRKRVRATTTLNDAVTLILLFLVIGAGTYNVCFGHFYVLDTVAPWIRSVLLLSPAPQLMDPVPLSYKVHILGALALLGFSPFSRLVHIWSVPFTYLFRNYIVFRKPAA